MPAAAGAATSLRTQPGNPTGAPARPEPVRLRMLRRCAPSASWRATGAPTGSPRRGHSALPWCSDSSPSLGPGLVRVEFCPLEWPTAGGGGGPASLVSPASRVLCGRVTRSVVVGPGVVLEAPWEVSREKPLRVPLDPLIYLHTYNGDCLYTNIPRKVRWRTKRSRRRNNTRKKKMKKKTTRRRR